VKETVRYLRNKIAERMNDHPVNRHANHGDSTITALLDALEEAEKDRDAAIALYVETRDRAHRAENELAKYKQAAAAEAIPWEDRLPTGPGDSNG
jgi:hypothetical protein